MTKKSPIICYNTPKKRARTYEFRIYTIVSIYAGDLELLATIRNKFKDIYTNQGRIISQSKTTAEEFARNIGMFGITLECPENTFTYYPPHRISKVEYNEVEDD